MNLRGATYNINMIVQLGGVARELGLLAAPGMASSDVLPLVSGTDVAAAADTILQDFNSYVGQVKALPFQLLVSGACWLTLLMGKLLVLDWPRLQQQA